MGEHMISTSMNLLSSQQYSVIASTHLQTFMIYRKNFYHLISTCLEIRRSMSSIATRRDFSIGQVTRQLKESCEWESYKRNVLEEQLPLKRLVPRKPVELKRISLEKIPKKRQDGGESPRKRSFITST